MILSQSETFYQQTLIECHFVKVLELKVVTMRILDTFVKLHIEVDLEKIDVKQLTDYPLNICDKLTLKTSHCSLSDTVLIWMASLNNDSKLSSITVVMPSDKLLNISQKLLPSALNNLGELEINFVVSNSTLSFRNQQSLIANSKDP